MGEPVSATPILTLPGWSREATTEESSVVQTEGDRKVQRPLTLYNLDAILRRKVRYVIKPDYLWISDKRHINSIFVYWC